MNNNFWTFFSFSLLLTIFFNISPSFCTFKDCSTVFSCGETTGVGFPFWGGDRPVSCGVPKLKLTCDDNITGIEIVQVKYKVLQVNPSTKTLRIARADYFSGICPKTELKNTTLDPNLFEMGAGYVNMTLLYGCDSSLLDVPPQLRFGCPVYGDGCVKFGEELGLWRCKTSVVVPARGDEGLLGGVLEMEAAIREGFEVKWKVDSGGCGGACLESGGVCGFDLKLRHGICLCETASSSSSSSPAEGCRSGGGIYHRHQAPASGSAASPGWWCSLFESLSIFSLANFARFLFYSINFK